MQTAITEHYNAKSAETLENRQLSASINVRNFNNWLKSTLITNLHLNHPTVLDICCGKGGDLPKWISAKIAKLVAVDIADQAVAEYKRRYKSSNAKFPAVFIVADCFSEDLQSHFKRIKFDLVSCQFALHYAFDNETRARQLFHNISINLRKGGSFICTIPNAARLLDKLRYGTEFGNTLYHIKFDHQGLQRQAFGEQYTFTLIDAVDSVPEYLVHYQTLLILASEYGLKLEKCWTFPQFHREYNNPRGLAPDEWEVIGIYLAFVFKKIST